MQWEKILQSVVAGVGYFSLWTLLVYAFYLLRNKILEYQLKRLIQPQRSDPDEDRVHVIAANPTDVRVTIRDVRLITDDDTHISLTYMGDTGDVIRPRKRDGIIARRRNPAVSRFKKAGLTERGFVELPAETSGCGRSRSIRSRTRRGVFASVCSWSTIPPCCERAGCCVSAPNARS